MPTKNVFEYLPGGLVTENNTNKGVIGYIYKMVLKLTSTSFISDMQVAMDLAASLTTRLP